MLSDLWKKIFKDFRLDESMTYKVSFVIDKQVINFCTNDSIVWEWCGHILSPYSPPLPFQHKRDAVYVINVNRLPFASRTFFYEFNNLVQSLKGREVLIHMKQKALEYEESLEFSIIFQRDKIFVVDRAHKILALLMFNYSFDSCRDGYRLIRYQLERKLERRNYILFHCGAIVLDDKGIVVGGPKGVGKTTIIFSLISKLKAHFMTNDKSFLRVTRKEIDIIAWPTTNAIAPSTITKIPELRDLMLDQEFLRIKPDFKLDQEFLDVEIEDLLELDAPGHKVHLTPFEISAIFGAKIITKNHASFFVFPFLHPHIKHVQIRHMGKHEVKNRISNLFYFTEPNYPDWMRFMDCKLNKTINRNINQVANAVANHCKCFEVRGGHNLEEVVNEIVKALNIRHLC